MINRWCRCLFHLPRLRLRHLLLLLTSSLLLIVLFGAHLSLQDVPATTTALDSLHDFPAADTQLRPPRILLVSAFFPLPTSKHSLSEYNAWLANFLSPLTTPIYFYTSPEFAPNIKSLRPSLPLTLNTSYPTPFSVPPLLGLEDKYAEMHKKDRESFRHNKYLYAVWNAKPWLLDHALRDMEQKGEFFDYAFWCDAGSFRGGHHYRIWPDPGRVQQVFAEPLTPLRQNSSENGPDPQIFIPLTGLPSRWSRYWKSPDGPLDAEVSEGSFFGGSPASIAWYASKYYAYHDYYLSKGLFVGKDQTLINALLLMFPAQFRSVFYRDSEAPARTRDPLVPWFDSGYLGACGSEWFYYQFFLAGAGERENMRQAWLKYAAWGRWGEHMLMEWDWWRERQRCRLTGVVGVSALLSRVFGNGWKPPIGSLAADA